VRQPRERDVAREHRSRPHPLGQRGQTVERSPPVAEGIPQRGRGIDLQLDQPADAVERVGEDPLNPPLGAVEVDEHREVGALRPREEHRRPPRPEQPPLDLGDLQVGIDRMLDDDGSPLGDERIDTCLERAKSHGQTRKGFRPPILGNDRVK